MCAPPARPKCYPGLVMTRQLFKASIGLALAVAAAPALIGCSSEPPSVPADNAAANVIQSDEKSEEPQSEEPEGPSQAELLAYFEALATSDPGMMTDAVEMAAPGSNAQAYAVYLRGVAQSDRDGGYPTEPQTAKQIEGGFQLCSGVGSSEECSDYTNIQHDGAQIADFYTGGNPLAGRISLGSGEAQSLGEAGSASLVAAYRSNAGAVVVVFEISSSSDGMWATATYTAPDGRQASSSLMTGPAELGSGAFANYTYFFEGAEFGGQVSLQAIDGNGYDAGSASFPTQ